MTSVLEKERKNDLEIVKVFSLSWYLAVSITGVEVVLRFACLAISRPKKLILTRRKKEKIVLFVFRKEILS